MSSSYDVITIRPNTTGGGIILSFCKDAELRPEETFELPARLAEPQIISVFGCRYKYTPTWKLHTQEGWLEIREAWNRIDVQGKVVNGYAVAAYVVVPPKDYVFYSLAMMGANDEDIETIVSTPPAEDWPAAILKADAKVLPAIRAELKSRLTLLTNATAWPAKKLFRLFLIGGNTCNFFHPNEVVKVLEKFGMTLESFAKKFISIQRSAVVEEGRAKDAEVAALVRRGIPVSLVKDPRWPEKYTVRLPRTDAQGQKWVLENDYYVTLSAGGLFAQPSESPAKKGSKNWIGRVKKTEADYIIAVLENEPYDAMEMSEGRIDGVDVHVSNDDPMRDRQSKAITRMADCIQYESTRVAPADKLWVKLALPCSKFLLSHHEPNKDAWAVLPLAFAGPSSDFNILASYELQQCHRDFLSVCAQSIGGLAGVIGPPRTGKTTLIVKSAAMIVQQAQMEHGRIALTAHSNQAARALLEKAHDYLPRVFNVDPKQILFVETYKGRQRRLADGLVLPDYLEAYSIESRRRAMAEGNPSIYPDYARHKTAPGDKELQKAWFGQERALDTELRKQVKIFICSLSTLGSPFFRPGGDDLIGRYQIDILVIDEASQAIWPNAFEAWLTVNPSRLILSGDDKQLAPFILSVGLAVKAWKVSPLEDTRKRVKSAYTLLDVAFRMPQNLYGPLADTIYDGKVAAHPRCENRAVGQRIAAQLKSLWIDPAGDGWWQQLGHNYMVFDVRGKTSKVGTSSKNESELRFLRAFGTALLKVGVPEEEILLLTQYQAHFDRLVGLFPGRRIDARKIDGFQGGEREIVCLSTVVDGVTTSNFLNEDARLCVGVSRQREVFALVGDQSRLQRQDSGKWPKYMKAVEDWQTKVGVERDEYWYVIGDKCRFGTLVDGWPKAITPGDYAPSANAQVTGSTSSSATGASNNASSTITTTPTAKVSFPPAQPPVAPASATLETVPPPSSSTSTISTGPTTRSSNVTGDQRSIFSAGQTSSSAPKRAFVLETEMASWSEEKKAVCEVERKRLKMLFLREMRGVGVLRQSGSITAKLGRVLDDEEVKMVLELAELEAQEHVELQQKAAKQAEEAIEVEKLLLLDLEEE